MVSRRRTPPPNRTRMTRGLSSGYSGRLGSSSSSGFWPPSGGSPGAKLSDAPAASAPRPAVVYRKLRRSSGGLIDSTSRGLLDSVCYSPSYRGYWHMPEKSRPVSRPAGIGSIMFEVNERFGIPEEEFDW